jgi:hypothetical protein
MVKDPPAEINQGPDGDNEQPGVLRLLVQLDEMGVEPVRQGGHLGLRGSCLSAVPQRLWDQLDEHKPLLLRVLPNTPAPFRQRQEGRAA